MTQQSCYSCQYMLRQSECESQCYRCVQRLEQSSPNRVRHGFTCSTLQQSSSPGALRQTLHDGAGRQDETRKGHSLRVAV